MFRALAPCLAVAAGCATVDTAGDLAAARALFERNLEAIQHRDRDGYLACYRADDALVRSGPGGPRLGFAELAAGTSTRADAWPEALEARDLEVHWLGPGFVYGAYRYRVVFGGIASEGVSERVFARRPEGWRIVVTNAFGAPASSDARLADLAFMAGAWLTRDGATVTEETWSVARGGTMLGSSRTVAGGRTTAFEHLRIEDTGAAIELVALPSGQAPARFRLIEHGGGRAVFADPAHDFPQRITYRLDGEQLVARIEGGGPALEWRYDRQ